MEKTIITTNNELQSRLKKFMSYCTFRPLFKQVIVLSRVCCTTTAYGIFSHFDHASRCFCYFFWSILTTFRASHIFLGVAWKRTKKLSQVLNQNNKQHWIVSKSQSLTCTAPNKEGDQSVMAKMCTPGVNFTNILREAFMRADPKSIKKLLNLTIFLRFWDLRA